MLRAFTKSREVCGNFGVIQKWALIMVKKGSLFFSPHLISDTLFSTLQMQCSSNTMFFNGVSKEEASLEAEVL